METYVLASMVLLPIWYYTRVYKQSSERLCWENSCKMKKAFLILRVETERIALVALA